MGAISPSLTSFSTVADNQREAFFATSSSGGLPSFGSGRKFALNLPPCAQEFSNIRAFLVATGVQKKQLNKIVCLFFRFLSSCTEKHEPRKAICAAHTTPLNQHHTPAPPPPPPHFFRLSMYRTPLVSPADQTLK